MNFRPSIAPGMLMPALAMGGIIVPADPAHVETVTANNGNAPGPKSDGREET
jgi:hypothetical protein